MTLTNAVTSLSWRRVEVKPTSVNASELIHFIGQLPGARTAPSTLTIELSTIVSGVEFAKTATDEEKLMRRAWRDRNGNGSTPLLLIADDPDNQDCIRVLGLSDANSAIRSIPTDDLSNVVKQLSGKSRLVVVRELTAELDRMDQHGTPGVKLRELLTMHTLDHRLKGDPVRWNRARELTKTVTSTSEWKLVLSALGYQTEKLPNRGYLARWNERPVALVHALNDPSRFSMLDVDGRPPEGVLLNECRRVGAPFGILASGGRLRLYEVEPTSGSAVSTYVEFDVPTLQNDDRAFLAILSPEYLAEGEFAVLREEARTFGMSLRKRLDETIRQAVLPTIGQALGKWAKRENLDLEDDETRQELERSALTLVFRLLFLMYAESAGFLPMNNRSYRSHSLRSLVEEAAANNSLYDNSSNALWNGLRSLTQAMRKGYPAWAVPAYNGDLFAPNGFDGASTLEKLEIGDADFAAILIGLGQDPESVRGIDFSTLDVGHIGHIYEGLLSLRLTLADANLHYDIRQDRYRPALPGETADIEPGDLLWQTNEGGRKASGVYYTRSELVRHLIRNSVLPAFEMHLARISDLAKTNPTLAAEELFDFSVIDPSCGSGHFLVVVVNELADRVVRFLGDVPLPDVRTSIDRLRAGAAANTPIEDVSLLKRLVLKRCVFGVDLSVMGAEVAKISLWLASFVPGLSLSYLNRNVVTGNSLVGVAQPEALSITRKGGQELLFMSTLQDALEKAAQSARDLAVIDDLTPDQVLQSKQANDALESVTRGPRLLFDLWTAEGFGLRGARDHVELHGHTLLSSISASELIENAQEIARRHSFLHWSLAFPQVFSRQRPGFDAVVGNPPWEEVKIEELSFYGLFSPKLRGLPAEDRSKAMNSLLASRPELKNRFERLKAQSAEQMSYFKSSEYEPTAGDPDLYKYFCQRYGTLLRDGGRLGVVLPRNAFIAEGSKGFRSWIFEKNTVDRIDFLVNSRLWMFDTHAQYTVALLAAHRTKPTSDTKVSIAGTAGSLTAWHEQSTRKPQELDGDAFGAAWTVPLLRSQNEADLLQKLRVSKQPFALGPTQRWNCFPVAELHETSDRSLWQSEPESSETAWALWKGESFDQYYPSGNGARTCEDSTALIKKLLKPRPGSSSLVAEVTTLIQRQHAVAQEVGNARVAFRGITRWNDSRTIRACVLPPRTVISNSAAYLAFVGGSYIDRFACLAILNSLALDWQARRFVEINLNFFILEALALPRIDEESYLSIAMSAARLSCIDERFAEPAAEMEIEAGPLSAEVRTQLLIDIDARVLCAYDLAPGDLETIFSDFTTDAVTPTYRAQLIERFLELKK